MHKSAPLRDACLLKKAMLAQLVDTCVALSRLFSPMILTYDSMKFVAMSRSQAMDVVLP